MDDVPHVPHHVLRGVRALPVPVPLMDTHEQSLIRAYNEALAQLKAIPKGDPRRTPAGAALLRAQYAIKRYRRTLNN